MTRGPSLAKLTEMFAQSREVLTHRNVATFEKYEKDGTLTDALAYVAVAAVMSGAFGLLGGPLGFLRGVILAVAGFLVFVYLVHWIGTQRGGTGTVAEVAYSFALFWAPINVLAAVLSFLLVITLVGIFLVPILAIAVLVANIYFAYLATQSSLNLPAGSSTWVTLILAGLASFVLSTVLGGFLGG